MKSRAGLMNRAGLMKSRAGLMSRTGLIKSRAGLEDLAISILNGKI